MGNILGGGGPSIETHLNDKVIWITGASSGLGRAISVECARRGAKVALSARDITKLESVKQECLDAGATPTQILIRPLDMAEYMATSGYNSFDAAAREVLEKLGGLDILINNAGISTRSLAMETSLTVDQMVMATNFWGPVALTKVAIPYLKKSQAGGQICVINSVQGKVGLGSRTSYSASKHALTGYFDSLRAELSVDGISVTAIFPGYIRTNLSLNALTGSGEKYAKMDQTTSKGLDPTYLALQILKAVARKKEEVVFAPLDARAAIFFRNLLPNLVFKIIGKKAKKLAAANSSNKQD